MTTILSHLGPDGDGFLKRGGKLLAGRAGAQRDQPSSTTTCLSPGLQQGEKNKRKKGVLVWKRNRGTRRQSSARTRVLDVGFFDSSSVSCSRSPSGTRGGGKRRRGGGKASPLRGGRKDNSRGSRPCLAYVNLEALRDYLTLQPYRKKRRKKKKKVFVGRGGRKTRVER